MAAKTISIDHEAYSRLKQVQQDGESLSQTIKRLVPRPVDWDALFRDIEQNPLSAKAAAAIKRQVKSRRASRNRR